MLTPPFASPGQQFNPIGKSFRQRIDAFVGDVRQRYSLTVRQDQGRTPEWQQKHHICHMFLYNAYQSTMPASHETGKRTISWAHLAGANVNWELIPFTAILRTKLGAIPQKDGGKWKAGFEPDQAATEKHAKELLAAAGIGNQGKAMISSGLHPCGEPCRCGAGRSKHLAGVAADLNTADMTALAAKLAAARAGTMDDYLKRFGLHRPLLHHPSSPEPWHIEATVP